MEKTCCLLVLYYLYSSIDVNLDISDIVSDRSRLLVTLAEKLQKDIIIEQHEQERCDSSITK